MEGSLGGADLGCKEVNNLQARLQRSAHHRGLYARRVLSKSGMMKEFLTGFSWERQVDIKVLVFSVPRYLSFFHYGYILKFLFSITVPSINRSREGWSLSFSEALTV